MNIDKRNGVIITQFIVGLISSFSVYMFLPLYPQMERSLSVSSGEVQLSLSAYYCGLTATRLLYGSLAHYFPVKKVLVLGLSLFVIGGILCAISGDLWLLLLGRFIEGMGMSAAGVLGIPIIFHLYENENAKRIKYISSLTALNVFGPMLSPLIGEFFSFVMNWRMAFLFTSLTVFICLFSYIQFLSNTCDKTSLNLANFKSLIAAFKRCLVKIDFIYYAVPTGILYGVLLSELNKLPALLMNDSYVERDHFFYVVLCLSFMAFLGGMITSRLPTKFWHKQYFYSCIGFGLVVLLVGKLFYAPNSLYAFVFPLSIFSLIVGAITPNTVLAIMSAFNEERFLISGLYSFILNGIIALMTLFFSFQVMDENELLKTMLLSLTSILFFLVIIDVFPKFRMIYKRL